MADPRPDADHRVLNQRRIYSVAAMAWKLLNRWASAGEMIRPARHIRSPAGADEKGGFMTRMMMMWLFGVPLSVMLLFMAFGIF
jgi:hypothetical protein